MGKGIECAQSKGVGKGRPDRIYSAAHGLGRQMTMLIDLGTIEIIELRKILKIWAKNHKMKIESDLKKTNNKANCHKLRAPS